MWRANSLEKTLILGKIEGRRRRGWQRMRWLDGIFHRLSGHEFGWTPGAGDGQGRLACCHSLGHKESDMIERLNWTELYWQMTSQQEKASILSLLEYSKTWPNFYFNEENKDPVCFLESFWMQISNFWGWKLYILPKVPIPMFKKLISWLFHSCIKTQLWQTLP